MLPDASVRVDDADAGGEGCVLSSAVGLGPRDGPTGTAHPRAFKADLSRIR